VKKKGLGMGTWITSAFAAVVDGEGDLLGTHKVRGGKLGGTM